MYNIIIVDDEPIICESLKSRIQRMKDLDVAIYTFENGEEALKAVNSIHPDIIITDIRMPEMDGLSLLNELAKKYPDIRSIAISSFDNYEYVRKAFRLGTVDYLLKPVSFHDLKERISFLIKSIQSNKLNKASPEKEARQEYALEEQFQLIFEHGNTDNDICKNAMEEIIRYLPFRWDCVGALFFPNVAISKPHSLPSATDYCIQNDQARCFIVHHDLKNAFVIYNYNEPNCYTRILEKCNRSLQDMNNSGANAFIALGEPFQNLNDLPSQTANVIAALSYRLVCDPNNVIEYSKIKEAEAGPIITNLEITDFEKALSKQNMLAINTMIDNWFSVERLKKYSIGTIENLYIFILHRFMNTIRSENLLLSSEFVAKEFSGFNNLDEIRFYLKLYISNIMKCFYDTDYKDKSIIDIAKRYIEENYCKEISMTVVANIVSLNYSYFSKLFKDQTGLTFSDYLMKIRMEEAKKLLSNPLARINEVSEKVGYFDQNHFSRAFKNYYGISPRTYRKKTWE